VPEEIPQHGFADIADHGAGLWGDLVLVHTRFPRRIFSGLRTLLRTVRHTIRIRMLIAKSDSGSTCSRAFETERLGGPDG
jgi:hypothetical protein